MRKAMKLGCFILHVRMIVSMLMRSTRKLNRLWFVFSENYPIEAPEVVFVGKVPDHEHIYSNGFICMSILYDGKLIRMDSGNERGICCKNSHIHVGFCKEESQACKWLRVHIEGKRKNTKGLLLDLWWW